MNKIYKSESDRIKEFKLYVEALEKEAVNNPLIAKEKAQKALIETGVLYKDGNIKKEIVKISHL